MEELNHYEGQVKDGLMHGKGKVTSPKGIVIEGTFENGRPEGEAVLSLPDGRVYQILLEEGKITKKKLIKRKEEKVNISIVKDPFRVKNGKSPKPKGGGFLFLGADFNDNEDK